MTLAGTTIRGDRVSRTMTHMGVSMISRRGGRHALRDGEQVHVPEQRRLDIDQVTSLINQSIGIRRFDDLDVAEAH